MSAFSTVLRNNSNNTNFRALHCTPSTLPDSLCSDQKPCIRIRLLPPRPPTHSPSLSKPCTYITHHSTRPPTVWLPWAAVLMYRRGNGYRVLIVSLLSNSTPPDVFHPQTDTGSVWHHLRCHKYIENSPLSGKGIHAQQQGKQQKTYRDFMENPGVKSLMQYLISAQLELFFLF